MVSLQRFTPRASLRTRLLLAAAIWTIVGVALLLAGGQWLLAVHSVAWLTALPVAIVIGWAKGRFVLAPRVVANSTRIVAAGESRCVGGAFSWESWAVAAGMAVGGALLRHSPMPRPWLGVIYTAVGTALLSASAGGWRVFQLAVKGPDSPLPKA